MGFASWYRLIRGNNKPLVVISSKLEAKWILTVQSLNAGDLIVHCVRHKSTSFLLSFFLSDLFGVLPAARYLFMICVEAKRLSARPVIVWSSAQVAGWLGRRVAFRNWGSLINVSLWKRDAQTWQQRGLSGRQGKWDNAPRYADARTWEGNVMPAAERKIKHATACFVKFSPKPVNN